MPAITLTTLGTFAVAVDGVAVAHFPTDKVRALLAYLALESAQPHRRERLAALLWPDNPPETALKNLRLALHRLRQTLDAASPNTADGLLVVSQKTIAINPEALAVDALLLQRALEACEHHAHAAVGECAACLARLGDAVDAYGGELLLGFGLPDTPAFDEWLLLRRESIHSLALIAAHTLARAHTARGAYQQALDCASKALALDPYQEESHRQVIGLLARLGQPGRALSQYERCAQILRDELGAHPAAETVALIEQIRGGAFAAPATSHEPPPPPRSVHHNLPASLTPFVGRQGELAELAAQLHKPATRLITIAGAGGMGKTRLALEVARSAADSFAHGVVFVALAPLVNPASVAATLATALDLDLGGDAFPLVCRYLRDKHLLLVLDNVEHVIEGVAAMGLAILEAAPQVQIVATSRERLNIRGEHVYAIAGLETGSGEPLAQAIGASSVALFAQCARRALASFTLDAANVASVLRICQLVGGMPLGLELAAAWVGALSLGEIAANIAQSADFLAFDWRGAPARQRSMRAVFDWSWRLLNEDERRVLRSVALFRGGFTFDAAQTVAGATLPALLRLTHTSLVYRYEHDTGARYAMHELLRQFAAEQHSPAERAAVEARHSSYYLAFVAARSRRLGRDEPLEATAEIQGEIDNVRLAWDWAVAELRVAELARAAYGWWQFCEQSGQYAEGRRTFGHAAARIRAALAADPQIKPSPGMSTLLAFNADYMFSAAPFEQMAAEAREAIRLSEASDDLEGEVFGSFVLGRALQELRRQAEAQAMWERTLALARAYAPRLPESELLREVEWMACLWLIGMASFFGDYAGARTWAEEALRVAEALGKRRAYVASLSNLVRINIYTGNDAGAREHLDEVLRLSRALGDTSRQLVVQRMLGELLQLQGAYAEALPPLLAAIALAREMDERYYEVYILASLVRLHCQIGDLAEAGRWCTELVEQVNRPGITLDCQAEALRACAVLALVRGAYAEALANAEQAWRISQQIDTPSFRAESAVVLGHARASMRQLDLAAAAYEEAVAWYSTIGNPALASEPYAGLAQLAMAQHNLPGAQALVETLLPVLAERPRTRVLTPNYAYLVCYDVLAALNDPRAERVLDLVPQHRAILESIRQQAIKPLQLVG